MEIPRARVLLSSCWKSDDFACLETFPRAERFTAKPSLIQQEKWVYELLGDSMVATWKSSKCEICTFPAGKVKVSVGRKPFFAREG